MTLAVGDGANDVAMIKAGHVGVGIIGKEGMQAVNSSDFAVGQFRFLRGLLLVHGRFINRRLSTLCFYMFYKNIVQTLVQFWFSSAAAWSGQTPYAQITINWFNMFYTSIPVIALAVNDMELPRYRGADGVEGVSSKPEIYAAALKSPYYTIESSGFGNSRRSTFGRRSACRASPSNTAATATAPTARRRGRLRSASRRRTS